MLVPSDTDRFAFPLNHLYVRDGGVLRLVLVGRKAVTITVPSGSHVNLPVVQILATGTTAGGIGVSAVSPNARPVSVPLQEATDPDPDPDPDPGEPGCVQCSGEVPDSWTVQLADLLPPWDVLNGQRDLSLSPDNCYWREDLAGNAYVELTHAGSYLVLTFAPDAESSPASYSVLAGTTADCCGEKTMTLATPGDCPEPPAELNAVPACGG